MAKVAPLLFSLFLVLSFSAQSQMVFNGNYEYWETQESNSVLKENPKGWTTRNHIDNNPQAVFCYKSSDSYTGQYAAVIQSYVNTSGISEASFMTLGSFEGSSKNSGVGFSLRPHALHFAYKYYTEDTDPNGFYKSEAIIELSAYDEASGAKVIIGKGEYAITNKTNFYQPTEVVIEYFSEQMPDSMHITFVTSSDPDDLVELTVDDVHLQMETTVGSDVKIYPNQISIFPNPVDDLLTFVNTMDLDSATLLVYNSVGQLILDESIQGTGGQIDCQKLNAGMYFYQILNEEELLNSGKLMKGQ